MVVEYGVGLGTLLRQGILEPMFYGDLVCKFKRIVGISKFEDKFGGIMKHSIRLDVFECSAAVCMLGFGPSHGL